MKWYSRRLTLSRERPDLPRPVHTLRLFERLLSKRGRNPCPGTLGREKPNMDEGHSQGPEGGNKIEDLCNIESSNSSLRSVAALTSPAPLSADGPSAGGNIWPGSFVRSFRSNNIPLSTSHSSSTQDERSSKMGDARYAPKKRSLSIRREY